MSGLAVVGVGIVVLVILASLTLLALPRRLAQAGLQPAEIERRKLQNEIVRTGVQVLGGGFFLATTVLAWRQFQNSQQELEVNRQTQTTERFTRAVDQLGSDELQVRVGGIYALERIAEDSPDDYYRPVVEVLAAFLRNRAPVPEEPVDVNEARSTRPAVDIQAAATVLGRRDISNDPAVSTSCNPLGGPEHPCLLDLQGVDLTGADLMGVHFEYANLNRARLTEAVLAFANLQGAFLNFVDLQGANLRLADLKGPDARLTFADLTQTNLQTREVTCDQLRQAKDGGRGAVNLLIECP